MPDQTLVLLAVGAACFAWATAAAVLRLRRDSAARAAGMFLAALVALAAMTLLLTGRDRASGPVAIATVFDAMVLLVVVLDVALLALSLRWPGPALGLFVLPLALALTVLAAALESGEAVLPHGVPRAAAQVHVLLVMIGVAALALASTAAMMYLVHEQRLRSGSTDRLSSQLPNLERLERLNRRMIGAGFALYTVGLALGLVLVATHGEELGLTLTDPKVISSLASWVFVALLAALGLRRRYRGRPVARLTLAAFVLLVLVMAGGTALWRTSHEFGQAVPGTEQR